MRNKTGALAECIEIVIEDDDGARLEDLLRETEAPPAIRLANDSAYGLGASIWSNDTLAGLLAAAMRPAVSPA